jgi:putative ABC transport system substrate-binding protein
MRRMGFLLSQSFDNEEAKQRLDAIRDGLQKLGWSEGRNLVIEARYASGSADRLQAFAAELVKVEPDVLFASATASLAALHKATQSIPIVFAQVTDPVGAGFVKSLARPGGNITGFTQHDFSIGVKWLELLKELSAKTDRVAIIYDPQNPATAGYLSAIKDAEQQFQVRLSGHPVRDAAEIEDAIDTVAKAPNSGLVILPGRCLRSIVLNLLRWRTNICFRRFTHFATGRLQGDWHFTVSTTSNCTGRPPPISTASLRARSRVIYQFRMRPSLNSSST